MGDVASSSNQIACPLPFATVLRRRMAEPRAGLRARVIAWLRAQQWGMHARGGYRDPLDLDGWPLQCAVFIQATREAQALLVPRGWTLASGDFYGDSGFWWAPGSLLQLHKHGVGYRSIGRALAHEGLLAKNPPAIEPLIKRPPLRVVQVCQVREFGI